jgi:hypothetical protein
MILGLGIALQTASAAPVCQKVVSLPFNLAGGRFIVSDSATSAFSLFGVNQAGAGTRLDAQNILTGLQTTVIAGQVNSSLGIIDATFDGSNYLIAFAQYAPTVTEIKLFRSMDHDLAHGGSVTLLGTTAPSYFGTINYINRSFQAGKIQNGFLVADLRIRTGDFITHAETVQDDFISVALPTAAQPNPAPAVFQAGIGEHRLGGILRDGKIIYSTKNSAGNFVTFIRDRLAAASQASTALTSAGSDNVVDAVADARYVGSEFLMTSSASGSPASTKTLTLMPSLISVPVAGQFTSTAKAIVSDFPSPISNAKFVAIGNELRTIEAQSQTTVISPPEQGVEFRTIGVEGSVVVQDVVADSSSTIPGNFIRRDISICY